MKLRTALATVALVIILGVLTACGGSDKSSDSGRTLASFIGRIDQDGAKFTFYGYVTHAMNVPDDVLFSDSTNHSESTARITFSASANMNSRSVLENVFALNSSGQTNFFFNQSPSAKFDDPSSFSRGSKVGTATTQVHSIITVTGPNQGLFSGSGEDDFTGATTVTSGGKSYTLVPKDARTRIAATGSGTRLEPVAPRATILLAGDIVLR